MKRLLIIGGAAFLIAVTFFVPAPADKIVFLDVGQGDSILVESGTQQLLVDGGPSMGVLRQLGNEMPWFDRNIEVLISTHPDLDHLEGLVNVLDRYKVGMVILPRISSASNLEVEWLKKLIDHHVPYRFAQAGQEIKLQDVTVKIINPPTAQVLTYMASNAENDLSVVAQVKYHGLSVLLTGDASSVAEDRIIADTSPELLTSDILKVGHHGSKASTSQEFLEAVAPRLAVISVGKDNKYGHPTKEVLDRLKPRPVYRTDQDGAVAFQYLNNQWLVKCANDFFTNSANSCMKREQI